MARLFELVLVALVMAIVCIVCHVRTVATLARREGWSLALVGFVFPPFAYVWGWRSGAGFRCMSVWTGAGSIVLAIASLLQISMR
jgi:hypothetical protein